MKKIIEKSSKKCIDLDENKKNPYNFMIDGVRWSEKYASKIEIIWKCIPNWMTHFLATIAVFLLASGIQGTEIEK